MATDTPAKRVLSQCIYCDNPPDSDEHWLNPALGTFAGNTYLSGRLCSSCNVALGRTIDQELAYAGHTGVLRQVLGIAGPTADPGKDGVNNLLAFALRLNPKINDSHVLTPGTGNGGLPAARLESVS